jgi:flagellar biogenesis protein FliO
MSNKEKDIPKRTDLPKLVLGVIVIIGIILTAVYAYGKIQAVTNITI